MRGKPAIRSMGMLAGISSIGTIIGTVTAVTVWWGDIPPELKEATLMFVSIECVKFVQMALAIIGRWRAEVPITSLFFQKR